MKVSILGACGRIGLPLTWIIASSGHKVTGIDANLEPVKNITGLDARFPYVEAGFEKYQSNMWSGVFERNVEFTEKYDSIDNADVILCIIGTPVDGENNPRIENIVALFKDTIIPRIKEGALVILRSTVSPGVTELIKSMIEVQRPGLIEGIDYYLVFAPERVSQGNSIKETSDLPQLIGAFSDAGFKQAKNFFYSLKTGYCLQLSPREAEYGKLITNMYRYVNIALANEMYMIAAQQGVDIHKVIELCNDNYPRMNMPLPGPNAAGPCLFKDGKLLVENVPFGDLINVAFHINEGMPNFMLWLLQEKAQRLHLPINKVAILGMTFKPGNDDIRFSAAYKLKKLLKKRGIEVLEIDPFVSGAISNLDMIEQDAFIVMTPHPRMLEAFRAQIYNLPLHDDTIIVDGWKAITKNSKNGVYTVGEYKAWLT